MRCSSHVISCFLQVGPQKPKTKTRGVDVRQSRLWLLAAGVCLLTVGLGSGTMGQTLTTATVVGTVTDPGGAAVPDAAIALVNKAINLQANQATNAAGQYTFVNVAPGSYRVTVKKQGFRAATVEDLTV